MGIAILGFGVVGSGAYEILEKSGYEVKKVLDLRPFENLKGKLTSDFNDILEDDEITVVVEAMGGLEPAHAYAVAALKAKKSVVTSNKFLMCTYFDELISLAKENGVTIRFGASVGGGIPWIYNLMRAAGSDEITEIRGIMNGTTNYILDEMDRRGKTFAEALSAAQALGYAERDPSADIDGLDVARKTAISASVAFGCRVKEEDVSVFSLRSVKDTDLRYLKENLKMSLRYMGFAQKDGNKVSAAVEPTILSADALEAHVNENYNMITLFGKYSGRLSFYGQGAGKYPTGDTVALDVIDLINGEKGMPTAIGNAAADNSARSKKYFIRTVSGKKFGGAVSEEMLDGVKYIVTEKLKISEIRAIYDELAKDGEVFVAGIEE